MKYLAVLFFGMFFWTQPSFATPADVSFFTTRGERFQVILDGRLVNRYTTNQLLLPAIPGGFHQLEIRLPDRFGTLVHRARIFVEPGFKTDYLIQVAGRRPRVVVSKARQYPLPVARPLPGPYGSRPNRDGHYENEDRGVYRDNNRDNDRYEDNDYGRYEDRDSNRDEDRGNDRNENPYNQRGRTDAGRQVMSATEVDRLVQAMAVRPFEDEKMALARQVLSQNTFYAEDLKRVLTGFSFDDRKLELAKAYYPNVYDQRNFYVVYEAFRFASDRRELEKYISSFRR